MGNTTKKSIRERISFFGDVLTTPELKSVLESAQPIIVDIKKLEQKNQEPLKKAA
jgi:hypothetical protein